VLYNTHVVLFIKDFPYVLSGPKLAALLIEPDSVRWHQQVPQEVLPNLL
jgi:hypothetical protein